MTQEAKILITIGVVTIILLLGGVFFLSGSNPPTTSTGKIDTTILIRNNSQKTGNSKAKISLVEFSDFQCPYCGVSYPFIKEIVSKYKNNLVFVYRHFPLAQHKNAMVAAEAAEAAGAQGKFWEMHDMLFENQSSWSESDNPTEVFKTYAEKLHLDINMFMQAVKTEKYLSKIQKDRVDGNTVGVQGTPTFFLNGEEISGYNSPSELKDLLDKKIQEKIQQ